MKSIYTVATNIAEKNQMDSIYLYVFPSNIGIALIYMALFKICTLVNITDYVTVATLFNSIIVGISGILLYVVTKKMFGNKKALMLLIILVFTTPFYLYSAVYYTDTISIFLILLTAYVHIKTTNIPQEQKGKKLIGYILLGLVIFMGMLIKITTLFLVIAYIVYITLNGKIKDNWKKGIIVLITVTIAMAIYNPLVNKYLTNDKEISNQMRVPLEQWISMGLIGRGECDNNSYAYIDTFPDFQQKKVILRNKIKETIKNYTPITFANHINDKLKFAWTDGTYYAPEKLRRRPVNNTVLHEIVLEQGKYSNYYKYFPQVMHMSMLIFILIGAINTIKKQDFENKNVIFYILMLGFIVFLLLWENRSRYILTGLSFFMIAMLEGIDRISTIEEKVKE